MTKVVHIQYSIDSAGRAAIRLQHAFNNVDVESCIVSLQHSMYGNNNIKYLGPNARLISRVEDKIQAYLTKKCNKQLGTFSYPVLGTNVTKLDEVKNADIIYIHWALKGLLNFKSVKQIAGLNKPVIIFLHDIFLLFYLECLPKDSLLVFQHDLFYLEHYHIGIKNSIF
mgnify:CR=1 FL=1